MEMKGLSPTEMIVIFGIGAFMIWQLNKGSTANLGQNAGQGSNDFLGGNTGNAANNSIFSGNTFGFGGNTQPSQPAPGGPGMYVPPQQGMYFSGLGPTADPQPTNAQQIFFPGS